MRPVVLTLIRVAVFGAWCSSGTLAMAQVQGTMSGSMFVDSVATATTSQAVQTSAEGDITLVCESLVYATSYSPFAQPMARLILTLRAPNGTIVKQDSASGWVSASKRMPYVLPDDFGGGQYSCDVYAEIEAPGWHVWSNRTTYYATPPCPRPVDFRRTDGVSNGPGSIQFSYTWESSTGNIYHLKFCRLVDEVLYPGMPSPFTFPLPFPVGLGRDNPTINYLGGILGRMNATHQVEEGPWRPPYFETTLMAVQTYQYECTCSNWGSPTRLDGPDSGPHAISRVVSRNSDGTWRFTIEKAGVFSIVPILP